MTDHYVPGFDDLPPDETWAGEVPAGQSTAPLTVIGGAQAPQADEMEYDVMVQQNLMLEEIRDLQAQGNVKLERIAQALERLAARGQTPAPQAAAQSVAQGAGQASGNSTGAIPWGAGPALPTDWLCPVHGQMKIVPAGTSQRTGKAYQAFVACPERGCNERPPRQ